MSMADKKIQIPCGNPRCHVQTKQTLRGLERAREFVCPTCGATTKVTSTTLTRAVRELDRLGLTLQRLAARRRGR